jgi:hypothetical protein
MRSRARSAFRVGYLSGCINEDVGIEADHHRSCISSRLNLRKVSPQGSPYAITSMALLYGLFAFSGHQRRTIRTQHRDRLVPFGDQDLLTAFHTREQVRGQASAGSPAVSNATPASALSGVPLQGGVCVSTVSRIVGC